MRSPHHHNFKSQRGVTLIELLVVIVIIAVVSAFALMQRGKSNEQFQRQNIARQLKVAFERARFDSVKRHAAGAGPATVVVNTTSYTLITDQNNDGIFQGSESVTTNFSTQNIVINRKTGTAYPVTVSFNLRGEATATASDGAVTPEFFVCNTDCTGLPNPAKANTVFVTPTGTVNLLGGGVDPPTFTAPAVANVPNTNAINPFVTMP